MPATDPITSADTCRRNGWRVGDTLEGYEHQPGGGRHGARIVLTAIGEAGVLARRVARDDGAGWVPDARRETGWSLAHRDWRRVGGGAAAPDPSPAAMRALLAELVRANRDGDSPERFITEAEGIALRAAELLDTTGPAEARPAPTPAPPCDNPACATPDVILTGDRWYRCLACGAAMPAPAPGPELLVTDFEEAD